MPENSPNSTIPARCLLRPRRSSTYSILTIAQKHQSRGLKDPIFQRSCSKARLTGRAWTSRQCWRARSFKRCILRPSGMVGSATLTIPESIFAAAPLCRVLGKIYLRRTNAGNNHPVTLRLVENCRIDFHILSKIVIRQNVPTMITKCWIRSHIPFGVVRAVVI